MRFQSHNGNGVPRWQRCPSKELCEVSTIGNFFTAPIWSCCSVVSCGRYTRSAYVHDVDKSPANTASTLRGHYRQCLHDGVLITHRACALASHTTANHANIGCVAPNLERCQPLAGSHESARDEVLSPSLESIKILSRERVSSNVVVRRDPVRDEDAVVAH